MHKVAVVAVDRLSPFDLGVACEAFAHLRDATAAPLYDVAVCAAAASVDCGMFELRAPHGVELLDAADTVLVPGVRDIASSFPEDLLSGLRRASSRGARVASICTGAFILAAAGLLDGRRATTHWMATDELARRYPAVSVDRDVLFVDEHDVATSAGASAGLDMCLHLVGCDHGQAVAAEAARLAVAPLHRGGGQAQFIRQAIPPRGTSLAPLLDWLIAEVDKPLDVATIAERACVSERTLTRRFREQTGTTPLQWIHVARIRRAQALLEETRLGLEQVASSCGFACPSTFRARFTRVVGIGPAAYRARFAHARHAPGPC